MMRCDQFDRWLDEGMPARHSAVARAHAAGCARCSSAMGAAEALEAMLAAAPPPAPAAMAMRVMERVESVERARERLAASERERGAGRLGTWAGWVSALAQEPAAVVAIALAPVFLILVIAWPETAAKLVALTRDALAVWFAAASSGALSAAAGLGSAVPPGAVPFDSLLLPAMVAAVLGAFVWLGVAFRPLTSPRPRKPPRA
jgi:hypothetical protein